jgi:3-oxoacyl-[acyl-carrier-protein] synthase II
MTKRVVVTGLGVISPLGCDIESFFSNISNGVSGVQKITLFDASGYSTSIAAEVKGFEFQKGLDRRLVKRTDRFCQFAVAAAMRAIEDAGLEPSRLDLEKVGVYVGSGIGGLFEIEREHEILLSKGPKRVSPYLIPKLIIDIASGWISILYGFRGPNSAAVTACASGAHSIGDAFKIIQRGDAELMVAGGAEAAITPLGLAGFCQARALSTRNDDPTRASRPFDRDRDGFVMGEGAGVMILESLSHARKRGARPYCEILGYGMSGDAYHVTAPDPEARGARSAMEQAICDAGIKKEEVSYINAHGTSTPLNDKIETKAIKKVFGEHAYKIPISSTKSMIGHLLGASGSVEAIVCCLSIRHSIIPPTINYETPDPECDLDYVPNQSRKMNVDVCISNSFGFGGHNAVLVFGKIKDEKEGLDFKGEREGTL